MRNKKSILSSIIVLAFMLAIIGSPMTSMLAFGLSARETNAFISVNPHLLGLKQPLTVNGWVHPQPVNSTFHTNIFTDYKVIFTKPDGTTDTIGPFDSEQSGTFWLLYNPDQVGKWEVKLVYPGGMVGDQEHLSSTSPPATFTVQQEPVQIGIPPAELPTDYWERPITSDNREWAQISGPWLGFGETGDWKFNRYSKGPETAHILWKTEVSMGGIFGGDLGSLSALGSGGGPAVIFMGKLYVNNVPGTGTGSRFSAIDLRTGEVLWTAAGSASFAAYRVVHGQAGRPGAVTTYSEAPTPILWGTTSSTWTMYNAFTGASIQTVTNIPPSGDQQQLDPFFYYDDEGDDFIVYVLQQSGTYYDGLPYFPSQNQMLMLNISKSGSTFANKIVWNITLPNDIAGAAASMGNAIKVEDGIGIISGASSRHIVAFDMKNGKILWDVYEDYTLSNTATIYKGKFIDFDLNEMTFKAYDMKTGTKVWTSPPMDYPWGSQSSIRGADDAYIYVGGYDGTIRAINPTTGEFAWKFYTGSNTETPYGTWAIYTGSVFADRKAYAGTSEHSPTEPQMRGNKLFCINTETGQKVWDISGALSALAISEGYLIARSENDGYEYCFGKGKTQMTISAPLTATPAGTGIMIVGTVTDQSPSQAGTPAVSDASMTAWMDYLHMSKPKPADTTGVAIKLTSVGPNGVTEDIGTVTSDANGMFKKMWTPTTAGEYTIVANFEGSQAYWSSSAETAVGVSPAATPSPTPEPVKTVNQVSAETFYVFAALLACLIIAVAVLVYRKK